MEFKHNFSTISRYIIGWFIVNTALAIIIALFIWSVQQGIFWQTLAISQIITHCTSTMSAAAGYAVGFKFEKLPRLHLIIIVVPVALLFALIGFTCSFYIIKNFFKFYNITEFQFLRWIIPSLIITIVLSAIALFLEYLQMKRKELESDIFNISQKKQSTAAADNSGGKISVKTGNSHLILEYSKIIYLSSNRKKSIIHSFDKDYEINQLLKEIEVKLPAGIFLRVHKQYLINVTHLKRLSYHAGGRYIAYLDDDDQHLVPVGVTYIDNLKARLNL